MTKEFRDRFEFRTIRPEDLDEAVEVEETCFPPNEACSAETMKKRIDHAPETFLLAIDKETGKIAGFLNGVATDKDEFRDEFLTDISWHDPKGKNVMLAGLDVMPDYRHKGLATLIMETYVKRETANGRNALYLTCLEGKIGMYEKMGYKNNGVANSVWGDEVWYEMIYQL